MTDVRRVLRRLGIEGRVFHDHLVALCPFHADVTPSWRIRIRGERSGLHHCFSCKEGGDLYDLVMHLREYGTRAAAVGWVEEHFGAATAEDVQTPTIELVGLSHQRRAFRMPAGFVEEPVYEWPTIPREYLEGRGVTADQAKRWGIGYALDGRLHGRVVLPIHNVWGELCSYVGRAFLDNMPKRYLYPREEEGGDLDVMFGERHWPAAVAQRGLVVVLEGAFKALAVERAFPQLSIAALGGSGVRLLHLTKLATFRRVVVFTDADPAGEEAGDELVASLSGMTRTSRVRLPRGEDADSVELQRLREVLWPLLGET